MGKEARRAGPITISGVTAKRHSETFLLLGNGIDQVAIQSTTEQSLVSRLEDECPYDFDIIPQEGSPSWIQRLILEGRNYTIEIKTPADIVTIKTSTSHRFTLAEGVQLGFKKSPADPYARGFDRLQVRMAELVDGVQVDCCLENDDLMVRFPEMALHKVRFEGRYRLAIRDTPGADSERCRLDQQSDVRYALVNPDTEDVLAVMLFKSPDRIIRDLKLDTPVYFQLIEVAEG